MTVTTAKCGRMDTKWLIRLLSKITSPDQFKIGVQKLNTSN